MTNPDLISRRKLIWWLNLLRRKHVNEFNKTNKPLDALISVSAGRSIEEVIEHVKEMKK